MIHRLITNLNPAKRISLIKIWGTGPQPRSTSQTANRSWIIAANDTGTLVNKFSKHIGIQCNAAVDLVTPKIKYSDFYPVTELRQFVRILEQTDSNQLPLLIRFTFSYRSNAPERMMTTVLKLLDENATPRIQSMDDDTIQQILYSLLFLNPEKLTTTRFYSNALTKLTMSNSSDMNKQKFIHTCFFLGLSKGYFPKNRNMLRELIHKYFHEFVTELSCIDIAIIANAAYKTSVGIEECPSFRNKLESEVMTMCLENSQEIAILITFLKAMRQQRIHSAQVCDQLSNWILNGLTDNLQLRGISHVLAYFAENLWDHEAVLQKLSKRYQFLIQQRDSSILNNEIRGKDLATFCWACAQLNYPLSNDLSKSIEQLVLQKLRNDNDFQEYPDQLIDCCLSLWMLGIKPKSIVLAAFRQQQTRQFNENESRKRNRFKLLQSAIRIEAPDWQFSGQTAKILIDLKATVPKNAKLQSTSALTKLEAQFPHVDDLKIVCPIEGLEIPRVFYIESKKDCGIFLHVLENGDYLHFSRTPIAIVRLQKRLLEALGHVVIQIKENELDNFDDEQITHAIASHRREIHEMGVV